MKRMNVIAVVLALTACSFAAAAVRDARWQKVADAMSKGLPKSAIEALEPILASAIARGDHPEAVRAIVQRISLEGAIQGNKPEEKIRRLEAEIAKAPRDSRPILEAVLARWYWEYFRQNRWRFVQRTATTESPGDDFTAWDLPRIYAEIDTHFTRALAAEAVLQKTPIASWDDVLDRGNVPDTYRPTLFDFIAFEAIDFYTSGEQAGARPEDAFELQATSPIFASAEEFAAWNITAADSTSPAVRALRLYQRVMRFHANDRDRSAWIDADLARLRYGYNVAVGPEKNVRYKDALKRVTERQNAHELSARAFADWASVVRSEGDLPAARDLARRGLRFENSAGGRLCWNLIQEIEAKELSFTTERVWNEPPPVLHVQYRNLNGVRFRIVPFDFRAWVSNRERRSALPDDQQLAELLRRQPVRTWKETLEPTPDFQSRGADLDTPDDLPPGSYYLIATATNAAGADDGPTHVAIVWVSRLALVLRNAGDGSGIEGFVLEAGNGSPVAGVQVRSWVHQYSNSMEVRYATTDSAGRFRVPGASRQHIVLASRGGQQLASQEDYWSRPVEQRIPFRRTMFFTDRALYRPGQTIRYKGLLIAVDTEKDRYDAVARESLTVVLRDPNGQEVLRARHRSNGYGSFSGTFTAPQGRLLGQMTIQAEDQTGAASISVEEYKRPKFSVSFAAAQGSPQLGDRVTIRGTATAYTGAAIDGANVTYSVVRQASYSFWWFWPRGGTGSQQIEHGVATTNADGTFDVTFTAHPDSTYDPKGAPVFTYTVHADVTDPNGETRSADRWLRIGYGEFEASIGADTWLVTDRPFDLTVRTLTLDGVARPAKGRLQIQRLVEPKTIHRPPPPNFTPYYRYGGGYGDGSPGVDVAFPDDISGWPGDQVPLDEAIATDTSGTARVEARLGTGYYRVRFETTDRNGQIVRGERLIRVIDPDAARFEFATPFLLEGPSWSVEPGNEFLAVWGSGYDDARAFVEIESRGRVLQAFWTDPGRNQVAIRQAVTEAMRGGFTLRVTMVHENRAWLIERRVDVPWTDRQLSLRWERFISKLEPKSHAVWTAVITGQDAPAAAAEMVATLYDASLDAFRPNSWPSGFDVFRQEFTSRLALFQNYGVSLQPVMGGWPSQHRDASVEYRHYPAQLIWDWANEGGALWGVGRQANSRSWGKLKSLARGNVAEEKEVAASAPMTAQATRGGRADEVRYEASGLDALKDADAKVTPGAPPSQRPTDLGAVTPRKNLAETAFFFPHLVSNSNGEVRMEFTMPEALTRWRFLGFAHDAKLRGGLLEGSATTSLDIMVQPNPPRFLREGDVLEFTVKVTNQSDMRQRGKVRLTFTDGETGAARDAALRNGSPDKSFDIPARESRAFAWRIHVPDGAGVLVYRAVASTGKQSDGEEGALPLLSRSILVTESLPLPIRGAQTKQFDFAGFRTASGSPTLRNQSFTVQMVSNPSWYAVMALPYLMEYPWECAEQTFNRLYANSLARYIANSQPKIHRVFEQWRGTPALDSPLEKNQELKAVLLEESPWVRQAQAESKARRNVGLLFEDAHMNGEIARALDRLSTMQLADGAWPWFPGGPADDYITLYIVTGFGRLRHLGVRVDEDMSLRALNRLDGWIDRMYREVLRHGNKDDNHLSPVIALYLYGRSFFLADRPIPGSSREAVDYWIGQARRYWLRLPGRQSQAHAALALQRFGDKDTPAAIMKSLRERAVTNEEMGMFWREDEYSWWWYRAPIETQSVMIEAFSEISRDSVAVEECKVWLLKQKQTQDWKTTKATADAVYALLLRGTDLLASDQLVEVTVAGQPVRADAVEAGTGFYEKRYAGAEITPEFAKVTVTKKDAGVAWGSVHWQYFEDMSRVRPYTGTPLTLKKALYIRKTGARGAQLEAVNGPVRVGDELIVRIELRVDRDMEYVHLKDYRGSGVEPVNVLSGFRYQDGLGYYEQTRDAASHFFIHYLPKGTYVFEYPTRVQHRGTYQTGIAQVQCMYAPEFNSHSESPVLDVR